MKLTALSYTAFDTELVVEMSVSDEGPDGFDLPMHFMGRIVKPAAGSRVQTAAELLHATARILLDYSIELMARERS